MMKKIISLLLCFLLAASFSAAMAATVETLWVEEAVPSCCLCCDGVKVCLGSCSGEVRLTLCDAFGNVLLDKGYGTVNGAFASETIYLPAEGDYDLTLAAGEETYYVSLTVYRGAEPLPTEFDWAGM